MKKKFLAILIVIVMVVLMLPLGSFVGTADNNGKVIVHFYNGDNEYTYSEWNGQEDVRWGSYYWIDTGKVVESGTSSSNQELDQEFYRTVDGVTNYGRVFRIELNATETAAVKSGKKLGLIMVRSYTDNLGYLTPYWYGNQGKDLSSDRYLSITFDSNNEYHVWIIAGDKNNYTTLASAKSAFEKIQSAKFDDFNTLLFQSTKPITKDTKIQLYKIDDLASDSEGTLYKDNLKASSISSDGLEGKITGLNMENDFDWNADYQIYIEDVSIFRTSCMKTRLYLSDKFNNECVPSTDIALGAIYSKESTTFRLWAPVSTNVQINFYKSGNELDTTLYRSAVDMTMVGKGVWEAEVSGDLSGIYYTYTNYVEGDQKEVVDVYAKAVGVNGNRAMVIDLDSTDPVGWADDIQKAKVIRENNSDTAVIWEIHVRDFSIAADNGITYKGKYLAFTEENTHIKGDDTIKTGISYLKDLGVTYVHLNPVYDFATVDEEYNNNTDYTSKQNWGYDPKNYNVPEGSYATNAEDGEVRVNEFKQMVQALHNAGIGVIMDVVYNHTYTSDSWFEQTVPGYYYRQALLAETGTFGKKAWATNSLGLYTLSDGSGCSNETASERAMFRKYMIDSVVYWAEEYHIDGFRFDLMAIHDVETMNQIRAAVNKLPGGEGILLYGEPWSAGALGLQDGISANADNVNELNGIKIFNDRMRDGVRGSNSPSSGYAQGVTDSNTLNKVMAGINGLMLNYSGTGCLSENPDYSITYAAAHDNYTLWDQLVYTTIGDKSPTVYSEYNSVVEKKNEIVATLVLTSKGTSFILAGEELARTKYGNHNSYNAQDKINAIDYYRQEDFSGLYNWYKSLIELRTKRFTSIGKGSKQATITSTDSGCIYYTFTREVSSDEYSKVQVMVNPTGDDVKLSLSGTWTIIANGKGFDFDSTKTVNNSITLSAYETVILVQK